MIAGIGGAGDSEDKMFTLSKKEECRLLEFERNMIENMQDLEPEFQKVIDENFWQLL